MRIEDTEIGMKVRISRGDCKATKDTCTITSEMKLLRGTIAKVTCIHSDGMVALDNNWS